MSQLEIKKENLNKIKVKLTVTVPANLMKTFSDKLYSQMAAAVEVKGFRKGHAPKSLTITAIGENKFSQELINLVLNETYSEAIQQEKILPCASPKISIRSLKDLTSDTAELIYEAEIDLLPEVKLGDYTKIKIKKSGEIKVTDEEVKEVLTHLQRQHAKFEEKKGQAEIGDRIEMDFEGTEKGVILENLTSKNYPVVLGSKVLIPEFEKEIIGLKKGDEKEFDVNMGKDKAKKIVHFKVKINEVQKVLMPVLNDELAGKFGQNSLEKLTEAVKTDIAKQKEVAAHREAEGEVAEALLKIAKFDVPESLVEQETHRMIDEMKSRTETMGLPFAEYLIQIKKTEEDLHNEFKDQAEKTVKVGLILGEVGKAEKIDLHDKDAGRKVMARLLEIAGK